MLRIFEERDQLLLSKPILDELLGVLARKFSRDAEELARVALLFLATDFFFRRAKNVVTG